jgi:hypothetical protein
LYAPAPKANTGADASKQTAEANLSSLASLAINQSITDLSYTADSTQCAYRSNNGSLAMQANSHVDMHTHTQRTDIQLTLSAEALGLSAADFQSTGGQPFHFDLGTQISQTTVAASSSLKVNTPTKDLGQLLQELSGALADILRQRGNKSISVIMDDEAIKLLNGDPKISQMMRELITLISLLGQIQLERGPRDHYVISLSGKGKPYLEADQSVEVDSETQETHLSLTILPPKAKPALAAA